MLKKFLLAAVLLFVLLLLHIGISTEKGLTISEVAKPKEQFDFSKITEEAANSLKEYIKIRSIRGNETQTAIYLQKILEKEGISSTLYVHPENSQRANLVAVLPGAKKGDGIIFCNHMDVVEVEEKEWSHPPFAGIQIQDRIYGRGAIDMKGLGIMQLYTFILLKRLGIQLKHDLMFLALADEESRSKYGAKYMLEKHPAIFKNYKYLLNEGGTGTIDVAIKGSKIFNIQYAEKGILWLDVQAKGKTGHGSTPPLHYAAADLVQFLQAAKRANQKYTITDTTAAFFYQMGLASPFPNSFVLKRNRHPLFQPILESVIAKNRHLRAMTSNTVSITGIHSEAVGINVITRNATATLDIRILPGVNPQKYLEELTRLAQKYNVSIKVRHMEPGTVSDTNTSLFKSLAGVALQQNPGAIVTPFLSPGTTDSSFFRKHDIQCYGLIPALLTDKEIDGIHGKNESIRIPHIKSGIKILFATIQHYNQ
ncbi:MAG: M20/M25/M40 family metallo-hydrolase [Spirochaetota bacterium]